MTTIKKIYEQCSNSFELLSIQSLAKNLEQLTNEAKKIKIDLHKENYELLLNLNNKLMLLKNDFSEIYQNITQNKAQAAFNATLECLVKIGLKISHDGKNEYKQDAVSVDNHQAIFSFIRSSIINFSSTFNSREIGCVLHWLTKIGYKKSNLQIEKLEGFLFIVIKNEAERFYPIDIAKTLNALEKMGYKKADLQENHPILQESVLNALFKALNKTIAHFGPIETTSIWCSLTKIGFTKEDGLILKLEQPLSDAVVRNARKLKHQEVANIWNALSKIGYMKENLAPKFKQSLLEAVIRNAQTCDDQEIANIWNGLAKVGYTKNDLANIPQLTQFLFYAIAINLNKVNSQETSMILNALSKMGYSRFDFPPEIESQLLYSVIHFSGETLCSQSAACILGALSKMGYTKIDLKQNYPGLEEVLFNGVYCNMNDPILQGLVNSINSLTKLGYSANDLQDAELMEDLLAAIANSVENFTPPQIINLLWSLTLLDISTQEHLFALLLEKATRLNYNEMISLDDDFITQLKWVLLYAYPTLNPDQKTEENFQILRLLDLPLWEIQFQAECPSAFQHHFERELTRRGIEFESEKLLFKTLNCDITINDKANNKVIVIEVQGPHHFSNPFRIRGDQIKFKILADRGILVEEFKCVDHEKNHEEINKFINTFEMIHLKKKEKIYTLSVDAPTFKFNFNFDQEQNSNESNNTQSSLFRLTKSG